MRLRRQLVVGAVLLLVAPSLWNLATTKRKHALHPPPGTLYSVHGHQMHLYCTGEGSPAVILEAAASATWLAWRRVQPQLSSLTRVCAYDRAGHGWSERRPGPRDAQTVARELHELLGQAGVQRVVLVGHSAGGLYVLEYARQFPADVAGVALIDASSPGQIDALPGWRARYERNKRAYPGKLRWEKVRVWSGWERLMGRCRVEAAGENPEVAAQYEALMCRPAFVGGEDSEFVYFEQTCKQAGRLTTFGAVPLLIISRDPDVQAEGISAEESAQNRVWDQEQDRMKSLSPSSWRVIARGAGHAVHHDRLDLVVAEITLMIEHLRGGPPPPIGSTVIR